MCGIAALAGSFKDTEVTPILTSMVSAIAHRGPDDRGFFTTSFGGNQIGLGHTRLAILDLSSAGHQPMADPTEQLIVTFNGEIYNFRELRHQLEAEGFTFRTSTDTEVILFAYKRWGTQSFGKFRGMFAFALLDSANRQLHLVRDPLGIKPLYYYSSDGRLIVASEVRSILASNTVERRINTGAAVHFLRCGWVGKSETLVADVRALSPGTFLTFDLDDKLATAAVRQFEWATPAQPAKPTTKSEAVAELSGLLADSVKSHLISDVPVGIFLSGGIDSTVLLAATRKANNTVPKTFTIVLPDQELDEGPIARRVARHFQSEHHEIELPESELLGRIPGAFAAMDQPTMDGVNSFFISEAVANAGLKVALSGLGADELFAGYPSFRRMRLAAIAGRSPRRLRSICAAGCRKLHLNGSTDKMLELFESDCSPAAVYQVSRRLFNPAEINGLLPANTGSAEGWLGGDPPLLDNINEVSRLERTGYMTDMLLRDSDFMSMAAGLELRVPFVDTHVVNFVQGLPGVWKTSNSKPKPLLLEAMNGAIPEIAWNRKKMGFALPFDRWLRTSLRKEAEEAFNNTGLLAAVGLSQPAVAAVWNKFLSGRIRWHKPWSILALVHWCHQNRMTI